MDIPNRFTSNLYTDLGIISYADCHGLQKRIVALRKAGYFPDTVLFLEHPPTFTAGRKSDPSNYPGIDPVRSERGGDITYHGPGQLVAYFIFDTRIEGRRDVGRLLKAVETAVEAAMARQGYSVYIGEEPGFWTGRKKIGSLGMAMDDFVSYHGISINTGKEVLEGFSRINPCGLAPEVMSWVEIDLPTLKKDLIYELSAVYGTFRETESEILYEIVKNQESMPTSQILS